VAELSSYTVPNLIQGVSQQADAQRDPSQGEIQINAMSSAAEGLRKREGSTCIAKVSTSSFGDASEVFFHQIQRDADEQYLVVITFTAIRVFDLTGAEKTVTVASGAFSYFSGIASVRSDIRAASIADYTFISNVKALPAMNAAVAPAVARPATNEALVWVKAANYGQRYTLNVNSQQVTVTTAVAAVVVSGSTTTENRISTADIAARLRGALLGGAASAITFQSSATTLNASLSGVATTTDEGGSGLTVNVTGNGTSITATAINAGGAGYRSGDRVFVQRGVLNGAAVTAFNNEGAGSTLNGTLTDLPTTGGGSGASGLTVTLTGDGLRITGVLVGNNAGTGYRANAAISVANNRLQGGPVLTLTNLGVSTIRASAGNAGVTSTNTGGTGLTVNLNGNGSVITAVTVVAAGARYHVGSKIYIARNLVDGGGTDTTPVHVATVASINNSDTTPVQIATIRSTVTDDTPVLVGTISAAAAGPLTGVTINRSGSVLHLTSSSAITIAATDARANADITAITNSVQAFTELPAIAPQDYQIEIVGDPSNKFDGYYVSFVCRSGTFGEGSWQETVSPGVQYSINQSTMPHLLVRLPNGNFWFGPANGSTVSGVTIPSWGQRSAGDYDSAPDPSFIGQPIQDVFIYKNRLGFLADENVILSRARDFFEFFPETVTAILDSDPIDLSASNNRVSVLRYAVPYQDELIIFSEQIQFRFSAADSVLTPSSAQITVLTSYEMDARCRPIQVQGTIMFCQTNGQWSQFREFSVRGAGTALVADASDITSNVTSYIPEEVYRVSANDTGNSMFVLPGKPGYRKRIYVYKYLYRNTGGGMERAQSSWSYWELNGANEICSMLCVDETIYMLVRYSNEVWLEKIAVPDRLSDASPNPYPLLLDRMVSTTSATPAAIRVASGTYNSTLNTTTWTLPYTIRSTTQAWSDWASIAGVTKLGEASTGTTITATGDWRSAPVYFGEVFTFRYRFTRFKLYQEIGGGKVAANVMRSQVRYAKLRHHGTPYFRAVVTVEPRDPSTYEYEDDGYNVSSIREAVFRIPINSRGDNCIVELLNDTAHPCKFSTCEWVGLLTSQARSLQ
jgi:hypothetical protein